MNFSQPLYRGGLFILLLIILLFAPTTTLVYALPNVVQFDVDYGAAGELTSTYTATIELDTNGTPLAAEVRVNVTATDGTATNGTDFNFTNPTQVVFNIGDSDGATRTVNVTIVDDDTFDGDETFSLGLAIASGTASIGTNGTQNINLYDNAVLRDSLIWTESGEIGTSALDGSDEVKFTFGGANNNDIVYNPSDQRIYAISGGTVQRMAFDGSNPSQILTLSGNGQGIAIDPVEEKIYATSTSALAGVRKANFDGTGEIRFFDSGASNLDIEVDAINRTVYLSSFNNNIIRIATDGTVLDNPLVTFGSGNAVYMAVDTVNNSLYWQRSDTTNIFRADLNGNSPTVVATSSGNVNGMITDPINNSLYYAFNSGIIIRAQLDGSSPNVIISNAIGAREVDIAYDLPVRQDMMIEFNSAAVTGFERTANPEILELTTWNGDVTSRPVTIELTVTGGTVGSDYTVTTPITIPAGTPSGTIAIPDFVIIDDTLVEANVDLNLEISNPTSIVRLGTQTTMTYTIQDDDLCNDAIVTNETELATAITNFNSSCADGDVMNVTVDGTIGLTTAQPPVNNATSAQLNISGGTLDGGLAHQLLNIADGQVTLDEMTMQRGNATNGGAIAVGDTLIVTNSIFTDNQSITNGGAIYATTNQNIEIRNSAFSTNTSGSGGAVSVSGSGSLLIETTTFTDNIGTGISGALSLSTIGDGVVIQRNVFDGNTAPAGGAITLVAGVNNLITNNTFVNNHATIAFGGGAVLIISGGPSPFNSTFTNNTFTNNVATNGGAMAIYFASVTLSNNIMFGTVGGSDCWINTATITFSPGRTNLIGTDATGANACDPTGANSFSADPQLGPLQNNDGDMATMAITNTSPAYNVGDNASVNSLGTDARGTCFERVMFGQVDLGAYEFQDDSVPCNETDSDDDSDEVIASVDETSAEGSSAVPSTSELLLLTALDPVAFASPGDEVQWQYTVTNVSTTDLQNIQAIVTYPDDDINGISAIASNSVNGVFTSGSLITTFNLGTMRVNETINLVIDTKLPERGGLFVGTLTASVDGITVNQRADRTVTVASALPSTGETPYWRNWILSFIYLFGLMMVTGTTWQVIRHIQAKANPMD